MSIAGSLRSSGLPDAITLVMLAAAPVVELRGAIPVAHWMGFTPIEGFSLSVMGNMIPVPLILCFLRPIVDVLAVRSAMMKRFFDWLFTRSLHRARALAAATNSSSGTRRALTALMLFVAIPLPLTGAWTGAIAASVLDLPILSSLIAIFIGVLIAGSVMTLLTLSGWLGASIAGISLALIAASTMLKASPPPSPPSPHSSSPV